MRLSISTSTIIKTLIILVCLIGLMLHRQQVSALSGLTISPLLKDVTLGPGLIETSTDITLQNNTDQAVRASLKLIDLRALGEYGGTTLDKAGLTGNYDLANWLSLPDGDTVALASHQTKKVTVNIANRADLTPGGHYGGIVITTALDSDAQKSEVSVNQQLISLLFIKKLGGEVYGLQLESSNYKADAKIPKETTTTFKNSGNVHVVPRGYIEVTDPTGKLVAKGTINQDSLNILPGGSRRFVTLMQPVSQASKPGLYKLTTYYRYDGEKDFHKFSQSFRRGTMRTWLYIATGTVGLAIIAGVAYTFKRKYYALGKSAK